MRVIFQSVWWYRVPRWVLGVLFVAVGGMKLAGLYEFANTIGDFGLVWEPLLVPTALLLATAEVVAGLGLLLDLRGSLAAVAGLLAVFSATVAYGLWLGLDIDCGCLGLAPAEWLEIGLQAALVRNLILLAFCGFVYGWRYLFKHQPLVLRDYFEIFSRKEGKTI